MNQKEEFVEKELAWLSSVVGEAENAELLFAPKIGDEEALNVGGAVLQHLNFASGTNNLWSRHEKLPKGDAAKWAARIWANTVAHLATFDLDVRTILLKHKTSLPRDSRAQSVLVEKVRAAFVFFMWICASPERPIDPRNFCLLKFIVLQDVILLEDINSMRNGTPGGWHWLDKCIAGLQQIGTAYGVQKIKAIATNERVFSAFLKRGFRRSTPTGGLEMCVLNYAEHLEFTWKTV